MDLFSLSSLPLVTCPVRDPSCCIVGIFLLGGRTLFWALPPEVKNIYLFKPHPSLRSGRVSLRFLPRVPSFGDWVFVFSVSLVLFSTLSLVVLQRLTPLVLQIPLGYWLSFLPVSVGFRPGEVFPSDPDLVRGSL